MYKLCYLEACQAKQKRKYRNDVKYAFCANPTRFRHTSVVIFVTMQSHPFLNHLFVTSGVNGFTGGMCLVLNEQRYL